MKIYIISEGDRSVGIAQSETTIDTNMNIKNLKDEDRGEMRKELRDFFYMFHNNGRTDVWFEDECPDCFARLRNGKCVNKGCISYMKE